MEVYLRNTKTILPWLICLTYASLFFPIRISNIFFTTLLVFCVINTDFRSTAATLRKNTFLKIVLALYLLQVIGLLYSSNLKTGVFMLEKKISLLLIPLLVLPLLEKIRDKMDRIFLQIGVITLLSSIVLLFIAFYKKFILHDPQAFHYGRNLSEGFTSIHYPYYAMYFACGSLMLIDCLFEPLLKKRYGLLCIVLLFIYSLGIMVLVASKTGIVVFSGVSALFLYYKLHNRKIFVAVVTILVLSVSILLYFNDATRERFLGLNEHLSMLTKDVLIDDYKFTGLNMRLLFWKLTLEHLWQDGLIATGVGTGDAQDYIDAIYTKPVYNYELYGYIGWDSHNQWVYALLQLGIAGVLVLGLLYSVHIYKAFKNRDLKFIGFLLITLWFSFSESILELNKGIIFLALFFTLLSVHATGCSATNCRRT